MFDEPFKYIVLIHIGKVKEFIKQQKNSKAIILTDHHYQAVIDVADDIYLLKNRCTKKIDRFTELEDYDYLPNGVIAKKTNR